MLKILRIVDDVLLGFFEISRYLRDLDIPVLQLIEQDADCMCRDVLVE